MAVIRAKDYTLFRMKAMEINWKKIGHKQTRNSQ